MLSEKKYILALIMVLVSFSVYSFPELVLSPDPTASRICSAMIYEAVIRHSDKKKVRAYYKIRSGNRPYFKVQITIKSKSYIKVDYTVENKQEVEKYFGNLESLMRKIKDDLNTKNIIYDWKYESIITQKDNWGKLLLMPGRVLTENEVIEECYHNLVNSEYVTYISLDIAERDFRKDGNTDSKENVYDFLLRMVSRYRHKKVITYKEIYGF